MASKTPTMVRKEVKTMETTGEGPHRDGHPNSMSIALLETPDVAARSREKDNSRLSQRITEGRSLGFRPARPMSLESPPNAAGQDDAALPEIHASALDAACLRAAIDARGCLIVRKLLPDGVIPALRTAIDEVIDRCSRTGDSAQRQPRSCYYDPPDILQEVIKGVELSLSRGFHRDTGSAMCAEAPSVAEMLLELYEALGLKPVVEEYLGESSCLSVKKWVLRKTKLPVHEAGWHQDGAFMGTDISSLNLWIPLTHCGGNTGAPGMDLVPVRLQEIVTAEGAIFEWSVDQEQVMKRFSATPPVSPVFEPGDALFFDHFFLHRTQYLQQFDRGRYAIETWFFGRGSAPCNQVPLTW